VGQQEDEPLGGDAGGLRVSGSEIGRPQLPTTIRTSGQAVPVVHDSASWVAGPHASIELLNPASFCSNRAPPSAGQIQEFAS
jgi:hypothetical protein